MGIEKKSNRWTLTIIGLVVLGGALIIGLGFPEAQWSGGGCGATPDEELATESGAVELAGFSDDAAEVDAAQAAADTGDNAPPSGADTDAHVGVDGTVAGLEHQCNSAYKEVGSSQEQCNLLRSEKRCLRPQHAPTRSSLCFWYAYPIEAEAEGSNDTQAAGDRGGGGDDGGAQAGAAQFGTDRPGRCEAEPEIDPPDPACKRITTQEACTRVPYAGRCRWVDGAQGETGQQGVQGIPGGGDDGGYDGGEVGAGRPIKEITDKCTSAWGARWETYCNTWRQRKLCLGKTDECTYCKGKTKEVLAGVPLRRKVVSICTWYGG